MGYIQETNSPVDEHVLVGVAGKNRQRTVSGFAPLLANGRDEAHQFSSGRQQEGQRQRVGGREVCSAGGANAGASGGVPYQWVVGGRHLKLV